MSNTTYTSGGFSLWILFAALGYFVYNNSFEGAFAILVLTVLYTLATFISFIPFLGIFIQVAINSFIIEWWKTLVRLPETWLTGFLYWLYISLGLLICVLSTAWVIGKWKNW